MVDYETLPILEDVRELRREIGDIRERIKALETHQEVSQWHNKPASTALPQRQGMDPAYIALIAKLAAAIALPTLIWLLTGKADVAGKAAQALLR